MAQTPRGEEAFELPPIPNVLIDEEPLEPITVADLLGVSQKTIGVGHPPRGEIAAGVAPKRGKKFQSAELPSYKLDTGRSKRYVRPPPRRRYSSKNARLRAEAADAQRERLDRAKALGRTVHLGADALALTSSLLNDRALPTAEEGMSNLVDDLLERRKENLATGSSSSPARTPQQGSLAQTSLASKLSKTSTLGDVSLATTGAGIQQESLTQSVNRIRTYTKLLEQHNLQHFIIWKGERLAGAPEFASFRRRYAVRWTSISHVVGLLEDLCLQRKVALALVDGAAVDALARCDLGRVKVGDLLKCIHNMDDADHGDRETFKRAKAPGLRPTDGDAATTVQGLVRGAMARTKLRRDAFAAWAAVRAQASFRAWAARRQGAAMLKAARKDTALKWAALKERLRADARKLRPGARRVEIHVPSLGYAEHVRLGRPRFKLEQAYQIARVLACADPGAHVVYVSPFPLPSEVVDYYRRLLALAPGNSGDPMKTPRETRFGRGALDAGLNDDLTHLDLSKAGDPNGTFTVVVPELANVFPASSELAAAALYSPACCRRLKHLAKNWGDAAVLVPGGACTWADKALALRLDVPLFGPDPDVGALYGSRAGAKRALHAADVNIPVGAHDIYDEEDFCVAVAKLVAGHLDIDRWRFGADADAAAAGQAYLDVADLDVVRDLRGEKRRLTQLDRRRGEAAWHHPDVQVLARRKLLRVLRGALGRGAVVCAPGQDAESGTDRWARFVALMKRCGGVVEAEPLHVKGRSAVHCVIWPDGVAEVQSAQDVLINHKYEAVCATHPAVAAPFQALEGCALAVAESLFKEGVVGYFTLHVVVHAPEEGDLRLWATDLELGMTPLAASHRTHLVTSKDPGSPYCSVPAVYHAGLAATKFATFFKLCRLHGISFDLEKRRGPVALLLDSLASGVVGCVTEAPNRVDALRLTMKFLAFLRKQLETAHLLHHVPGPADRELPDLQRVVAGALKALEAEQACW